MKQIKWNDSAKKRLDELREIFLLNKGVGISLSQKDEMVYLHALEHAHDVARFGNLLSWLTLLLYQYDPIDLVPCHIPLNEYDIEARMILKELAIREQPGLKEIIEVVHQVFVIEFDEHSAGTIDRSCYEAIGKELLARIKQIQTPPEDGERSPSTHGG